MTLSCHAVVGQTTARRGFLVSVVRDRSFLIAVWKGLRMIRKSQSCQGLGRYRAFTLVELLVVIAIIGVLVALLYNTISSLLRLRAYLLKESRNLDLCLTDGRKNFKTKFF